MITRFDTEALVLRRQQVAGVVFTTSYRSRTDDQERERVGLVAESESLSVLSVYSNQLGCWVSVIAADRATTTTCEAKEACTLVQSAEIEPNRC